MGEYIENKRTNDVDKLGTCENLYYTTYDELLTNSDYSENDKKVFLKTDSGYRFRFPFPDEIDKNLFIEQNFDRGVLFMIPRTANVELSHDDEMFNRFFKTIDNVTLDYGYLMPCPESENNKMKKFLWNTADRKPIEIVQQKMTSFFGNGSELVTVARCPYCNARSLMTKDEIEEMIKHIDKNDEFRMSVLEVALKGYK